MYSFIYSVVPDLILVITFVAKLFLNIVVYYVDNKRFNMNWENIVVSIFDLFLPE